MEQLTDAEWKVLRGIHNCWRNQAIADKLGVDKKAVERHIGNIISKTPMTDGVHPRMWVSRYWYLGTNLIDLRGLYRMKDTIDEVQGKIAGFISYTEEAEVDIVNRLKRIDLI